MARLAPGVASADLSAEEDEDGIPEYERMRAEHIRRMAERVAEGGHIAMGLMLASRCREKLDTLREARAYLRACLEATERERVALEQRVAWHEQEHARQSEEIARLTDIICDLKKDGATLSPEQYAKQWPRWRPYPKPMTMAEPRTRATRRRRSSWRWAMKSPPR